MTSTLPERMDTKSGTTATNPHRQLDQNATKVLPERLREKMARLPGTHTGPSLVSVPGARAAFRQNDAQPVDETCFMKAREFAHPHPSGDGGLYVTLPDAIRNEALAKGWAEPHPLAARGDRPGLGCHGLWSAR